MRTALLRRARPKGDARTQNADRAGSAGREARYGEGAGGAPLRAPGIQGAGAARYGEGLGAVRDFPSRGAARGKRRGAPSPGPGARAARRHFRRRRLRNGVARPRDGVRGSGGRARSQRGRARDLGARSHRWHRGRRGHCRGVEPGKGPAARPDRLQTRLVFRAGARARRAGVVWTLLPRRRSHRRAAQGNHRGPDPGRGGALPRRRRVDGGRARPPAIESAPRGHRRSRSETLTMRSRAVWILMTLAAAASAQAGVKIDHWTAESGARVSFVESHALPIVDVAVEFAAGSAYDSREQAGLARLALAMLKAGSSRYSETEASRRIADAGAQLQENFDLDRAGFALRSLSSEAERKAATQTLADMLQAPLFPGEAFEREKASAIANAREAETQPDRVAERRLYALMYPAHPYGFSETPDTLASIRREDVERHYRNCYGSARAVVTIVGDLDRDAAKALAEELTSRLSKGTDSALAPVAAPAGATLRVAHPSTQSHVLLGVAALTRADPDYFPLFVGNYSLGGGGFMSRLLREIREKRGYAYSVYSMFRPYAREGPFLVGLETRRDQAREALELARSIVVEFVKHGPTEAELKAAKKSLVGGFPLRIDTNRKILEQIATVGFYRLPLDWLDEFPARVEGVTVAQVKSAFARRIAPEKLSIVVVGAQD